MREVPTTPMPLDVIVEVNGQEVIAELDVSNNTSVRVGDRYIAESSDGSAIVLRVRSFRSAERYTNTIARGVDAMREGVIGPPQTLSAQKAFQTKLAVLTIEGELLSDGTRRVGATRTPEVMVPIRRITDAQVERFAANPQGNVVLGNLRSSSRTLDRLARIELTFAGERMVVQGMPGKGKSQLVRSLLSQAMAQADQDDEN